MEQYESCEHGGCAHFNAGWCEWNGLPSGYNLILRCYGMACMGCGYEPGAHCLARRPHEPRAKGCRAEREAAAPIVVTIPIPEPRAVAERSRPLARVVAAAKKALRMETCRAARNALDACYGPMWKSASVAVTWYTKTAAAQTRTTHDPASRGRVRRARGCVYLGERSRLVA